MFSPMYGGYGLCYIGLGLAIGRLAASSAGFRWQQAFFLEGSSRGGIGSVSGVQ